MIHVSSKQTQMYQQSRIVTFTGSKISNLAILSMIIVVSLFVTLLWTAPDLYYLIFGAFILSPTIILGFVKLKNTHNKPNSFSLSRILLILLIVFFIVFNISRNNDQVSLTLIGFFSNSFLLTAWTLMPYSTSIERKINDECIKLIIKHRRLFIGTSITQISIKRGGEATLKPSEAKRSPFSKSFVFHHLYFSNNGRSDLVPFLPFPERGIQMAAKLKMVFEGADCQIIIDRSLLNSRNLFKKLIFPKVSTKRFNRIGNDLEKIAVNDFIPLLFDPRFKRSRLVPIKNLLVALIFGLLYFVFQLFFVYVLFIASYVLFNVGWYILFILMLYLLMILTIFSVIISFQGVLNPLFLLVGHANLEYENTGFLENNTQIDTLLLKYRLGFITGMKIKLPTILNPKIIKSTRGYSIRIFLDSQHQLQLPLGSIT